MLKRHPGMITRSCFVDPVVFCSWEGGSYLRCLFRILVHECWTARCLLQFYTSSLHYRMPFRLLALEDRTSDAHVQGMELLLRYFVATELGVANLIQRHYDWVANT